MSGQKLDAGANGAFCQLHLPNIFLRQRYTGAELVGTPGQISRFGNDACIQQCGGQIQQAGAAKPHGFTFPDDMERDFTLLQRHMIHRSGGAAHAAGDFGAFKCWAGGSGTGNSAIAISQYHLSVGADVDQQRQSIQLVKSGGHHAAHGIAAYKPCNVGKNAHGAGGGKERFGGKLHGFLLSGHIWRRDQRGRIDPKQQMVHGSVSHNGSGRNVLRGNGDGFGHAPRQASQGVDHAPAQRIAAALQRHL